MIIHRRKFEFRDWRNIILLFVLSVTVIAARYDRTVFIQEAKKLIIKHAGLSGKSQRNETISNLTRIPLEFIKGRYPARIKHLGLHIRQKFFSRISEERNLALQRGILRGQNTYPLIYRFEGRTGKGKIRLKGDLPGHWIGNDQWSFRIRLGAEDFINGFKEFSVQTPVNRQYPYDYIFHTWMDQLGNIAPCYDFFYVSVNGDDWGIMLAEEQISPTLLEKKKRKPTLIFRLEDQSRWFYQWVNEKAGRTPDEFIKSIYDLPVIDHYGENKINQSALLMNYAGYCEQQLIRLLRGQLAPSEFLDVDSFSLAFLTALAWHDYHALAKSNARYCLNPYTLKLEIITSDAADPNPWNPADERSLLNLEQLTPRIFPLICRLLTDPVFHDACRRNVMKLEAAWLNVPAGLKKLDDVFPLESIHFPACSSLIQANLQILKSELDQFLPALSSHCSQELKQISPIACSGIPPVPGMEIPRQARASLYASGTLEVFNLMSAPLTVDGLRWREPDGSSTPVDLAPFTVSPGCDGILPTSSSVWIGNLPSHTRPVLEITTSCGDRQMTCAVSFIHGIRTDNPLSRTVDLNGILPLSGVWGTAENQLILGPGDVVIHQPLILAEGINLIVHPATVVSVEDDAFVIIHGQMLASGHKEARIRFQPRRTKWKGILITGSTGLSIWESVDLLNSHALDDGILNLTGTVNFYKSPVQMTDCRFISNQSEDQLNLVHCRFTLTDCEFSSTSSDAIDSDFSTGTITNCRFQDVQGDAIDTSGSTITIQGMIAGNIHDKAVSGGECSNLVVHDLHASNVGSAIVAKDGSQVQATAITVQNALIKPFMVYTKKPFFNQSSQLIIHDENLQPEDVVVQTGNRCIMNDRELPTTNMDVKALYSSGPMKKSR